MGWTIRYAEPSDALFLTSISLSATKYWGDSESQAEMSQYQLLMSEAYIMENTVFVAEKEGTIIGYCSMSEVKRAYWKGKTFIKAGHWLEQLFIRPAYIESSIGDELIEALIIHCKNTYIEKLNLLSDTCSNPLFEKIGAKYIKALRTSVKGNKVYLFELTILEEKEQVKRKGKILNFPQYQFEEELEPLESKRDDVDNQVLEQNLQELNQKIDKPKENKEIDKKEDIEPIEDKKKDKPKKEKTKKTKTKKSSQEKVEEDIYNLEESHEQAIDETVYELPKESEALSQAIAEAAEIYSIYMEKEESNIEPYIPWGDQIVADKIRVRRLLREFNRTDPESKKQTTALLKQLFGTIGEHIHIEPDFKCNFGYNIHVGNHFYADYNCVILDNARVTIGENCILSPQVGIYTLAYPKNREQRVDGYEYALPITIGDDVWIGGGTVIYPGVTIGDNVIIEPGSVVSVDIPGGVIAGGNPARKIEDIEK